MKPPFRCRIFGHKWVQGARFWVDEPGGPIVSEQDVCARCKVGGEVVPYRGSSWGTR